MTRISFAPELSATLRRVSCWTTTALPHERGYRGPREIADFVGWSAGFLAGPLLRLLHDLKYTPAFLLGDRARLGDADKVAHAAFVLLVVDLEAGPLLHGLPVKTVGLRRAHLDDDGLVHLVGDHGAQADLALSALGRRRLHRLLVGRHQEGSSDLALRPRLGLGASAGVWTTGASGSKPASGSATATAETVDS